MRHPVPLNGGAVNNAYTDTLTWKLGVEIEFLAPSGSSRRALAEAIAEACGGVVKPCFHPQSEPSTVRNLPIFQNLTLGFDVFDAEGALLARCLDDLTLQADLDRQQAPLPGWYRIASDDPRLLNLIIEQCDAAAAPDVLLDPIAELFGSPAERNEDDLIRVNDREGASIAILAPLPGERERPCELVTRPMEGDVAAQLEAHLCLVRDLEFSAPSEGATHLHFDATRLKSARTISMLVQVLSRHRRSLQRLFATNPNCVRLGDWPRQLHRLVGRAGFTELDWPEARSALNTVGLTKYYDFNLVNMVEETPDKNTLEVRILPTLFDAGEVVAAAAFFGAILDWCIDAAEDRRAAPRNFSQMIDALPLPAKDRQQWIAASES